MSTAPLGALLLAGGTGQRLWPLSRKNSPKQFAPLIGEKSSFQLAVERLAARVPSARTYVGTNRAYEPILRAQAPALPAANFLLEPCRRDVAAAVNVDPAAVAKVRMPETKALMPKTTCNNSGSR